MYKVILGIKSRSSLIQIREYIAKDSIFYAHKTVEEILKRVNNLATFPYMGRQVEVHGKKLRQIIYKSYKIFYKLEFNRVYILQIFHHSRDISNLKIWFSNHLLNNVLCILLNLNIKKKQRNY